MTLAAADINVHYPVDRELGGKIGFDRAATATGGNIHSLANSAELLAGRTQHRKFAFRVNNADGGSALLSFARQWSYTASAQYSCWFSATETDVSAGITGTENKYGMGRLKADVLSTATSFTVIVEDSALASGNDAIFKDTYLIGVEPAASLGSTVSAGTISGAPVVSGTEVTITLAAAIGTAYSAGDYVSSHPDKATVETEIDTWDISSIGTTTVTQGNVYADNIGCPRLTVTITIIDATTYSASCDWTGLVIEGSMSMGTGISISADFAPVNLLAPGSRPVITIPAGTIGGSPVNGDTFSFVCHPADYNIWSKQVIPAATASVQGDQFYCRFQFEG